MKTETFLPTLENETFFSFLFDWQQLLVLVRWFTSNFSKERKNAKEKEALSLICFLLSPFLLFCVSCTIITSSLASATAAYLSKKRHYLKVKAQKDSILENVFPSLQNSWKTANSLGQNKVLSKESRAKLYLQVREVNYAGTRPIVLFFSLSFLFFLKEGWSVKRCESQSTLL